MELLLFAIFTYFVMKAVASLVTATRDGLEGAEHQPRMGGDGQAYSGDGFGGAVNGQHPQGWRGPSPRNYTGNHMDDADFWAEDIEDAKWKDV